MNDLESYRRSIGLFKAQHLSIVKTSMMKGTNPKSRLSYSSLFLAVVSLPSILCFLDKGIEKNPGPPNKHCQAFDYESDTEKFAFLNLKKLVMSLIKVKSHLSFLNICRENNAIPNGLMSDCFFSIHNKLKLNLNTLILYRPWCKKTQGHLAYTKNGTYNFQIQLRR